MRDIFILNKIWEQDKTKILVGTLLGRYILSLTTILAPNYKHILSPAKIRFVPVS
jgi:hypothetical protein